jgi:type IV pilus assembly protein PilN
MRLDINLASQPYEDARQFWMRWGTAVGALGLLTILLLAMTITGWANARHDHAAIASVRQQIADRDAHHAEAEAFLNRSDNRSTRDESQFLNELIERKSFSWTQVLESMEKVMPPRVHLVNITPASDEDNQISLKMTVAGESRDRVLELMRRMEESQRFAHTNMTGEAFSQTANGDSEKAEIVALYIPEPPPSAGTKSSDKSKGDSTKSDGTKSGTFGNTKPKTASPKPISPKPISPKPMTGVSTPPPAQRSQN